MKQCPDCGSQLHLSGGCWLCLSCGYTSCRRSVLGILLALMLMACTAHAQEPKKPVQINFTENCRWLELHQSADGNTTLTFINSAGRLESARMKRGTDYTITWGGM